MKTLERHLGWLYVVSISLWATLGAGLFVLPGMAVAYTGSQVWLAFLIAGICVVPGALSKSELATAMPSSGGTYWYIERAFGPLAGTIGGVGLWLSLILKTAFALIGLSWYLGEVIPEVSEKELETALWEREKIQNTGVGEGVALPHATVSGIKRSFLGVFTTSERVSYGGDEQIDVFFVMVGPPEERQTHLALLSKLAKMAITPDILV